MRRMKWVLGFVGFLGIIGAVDFLGGARMAEASVMISEILADPANGLAGDSNGDGTRSSDDDEFVELFNTSSAAVDLSGWKGRDSEKENYLSTRD